MSSSMIGIPLLALTASLLGMTMSISVGAETSLVESDPAPVGMGCCDRASGNEAVLIGEGSDLIRLSGEALTAASLRQAISAIRGPSRVLLLRVAGGEQDPQVLLQPAAAPAPPLSVGALLTELQAREAESVLLLLEVQPALPDAVGDRCHALLSDVELPEKTQAVLICGAARSRGEVPSLEPGLLESALAYIEAGGVSAAEEPETAWGLLANADARLAPGASLMALIRGRDWSLPTPGVASDDKLDRELLALSNPDLGASDLTAALARLEQAGVAIRTEPAAALSVRVTAVSADAAARVRALVERTNGEVSASFQDTLFALLPVDQVRALAASPDIWSIAINRPTSRPFGP